MKDYSNILALTEDRMDVPNERVIENFPKIAICKPHQGI